MNIGVFRQIIAPKPFFSVLAALLVIAEASHAQSDIGTQYRGYPNSACSDFEGFVIHETSDLTVVSASCHGSYEAWLSKKLTPEKDATMIVLDHMRVPELKRGETFSSGPYCYRQGQEIKWLAIYDWKKRAKITRREGGIRQAWVVNAKMARFEPAPNALLDEAVCLSNDDE